MLGLIPRPSLAARGRGSSSSARAMVEPLEELSVVGLDAHGHGVTANGATVPGALPGERALVRHGGKRTELIQTLDPSPERAEPICRWFGTCGGCVAQHMSASLYQAWKRSLVVEALKREGVSAKVEALVDAHGAGRRRATFHARFPHGQPDEVGFMRARSHDIIAIDACPLFSPGMAGAIPAARALSGELRGLMKPLDIAVSATLEGLDVDMRGSGPLGRGEAQKLIADSGEARSRARLQSRRDVDRASASAGGVRRGACQARRPAASCKRPGRGRRGSRDLPSGPSQTRKGSRTCSAARARSR